MCAPAVHVVVAVAFVAIALVLFARDHWGGVYDDAFIYLRYVKNLRAGCGLRFNCDGPPVEGFTGPLYLARLWLGSLVTHQLIDLSQIVCTAALAVALALAVWAAAIVGRHRPASRLSMVLAGATAIVLALDHFVLLNAITGMETALAAAAVSAIALAAVTDRPWLLVAAVGAGLLVRPENLVFVVALPILPALRRPKYLATAAGIVIAIGIARYRRDLAALRARRRLPRRRAGRLSARVSGAARAGPAGRPRAPRVRVPPGRQRGLGRVLPAQRRRVATGLPRYQFHRDHRCPGDHP